MAKNRIKRTVSDLDAQSIESFLNGGSSSYTYSSESYSSYSDPVLGQEAINILSDIDTDHGTALMHTMEALNEANMISKSLEYYIEQRNLKIKMCNAFSRAAKSKGYSIEAIDFWRSMESDDDDEDKKKDKGDDKWYKNAWEAIKAFFKKIILAVINFVKTIGNFIKGAICKAQDLFYKKYAKDVYKKAEEYCKNKDNEDIKYKIKSISDKDIWKVKPWNALKSASVTLVGAFQEIHQVILEADKYQVSTKSELINDSGTVMDIVPALYTVMTYLDKESSKKMKEQAGKWFPSAKKVVNSCVYGKEDPSKHEIPLNILFNSTNNAQEVLSPAALTSMTFAFKTAQQANKNLTNALKVIEKMSKQNKSFDGSSKTKNGKASIDKVNDAKRMCQFTTTLLIQLYGECLSCRMSIFSAAKKLYKKGEYKDDDK